MLHETPGLCCTHARREMKKSNTRHTQKNHIHALGAGAMVKRIPAERPKALRAKHTATTTTTKCKGEREGCTFDVDFMLAVWLVIWRACVGGFAR